MAETESIYRASDGREVSRGGLGAVCAGDVAESAPQEALGWAAGLIVGAVTRAVTRPDLGLITATQKRYPSDLGPLPPA